MASTTAAEFIAAKGLDVKEFKIPGLSAPVCMRSLSGLDMERAEAAAKRLKLSAVALYLAYAICDEDGKRIFADDQAGEIWSKPMRMLKPLMEGMREMNGVSADEIAESAGKENSSSETTE